MNLRPLPFTVYPKKSRMVMLFLVCVAFVGGGILMIRDGQRMGWLCAGFFGLGIPVFLIQLYPKSSLLTVSEDGIEFCSLFRRSKLQWSDISEFGVYTIRQHGLPVSKMVGLNYSREYQRLPNARALSKAGDLDHSPNRNFFTLMKARAIAGKYRARRIAMIAMTHNNSVRVNPALSFARGFIRGWRHHALRNRAAAPKRKSGGTGGPRKMDLSRIICDS